MNFFEFWFYKIMIKTKAVDHHHIDAHSQVVFERTESGGIAPAV